MDTASTTLLKVSTQQVVSTRQIRSTALTLREALIQAKGVQLSRAVGHLGKHTNIITILLHTVKA